MESVFWPSDNFFVLKATCQVPFFLTKTLDWIVFWFRCCHFIYLIVFSLVTVSYTLRHGLYLVLYIILFDIQFRIYQKNNLIIRFYWNPILIYPHIMILDFRNSPWMNKILRQMYLPLLQFILLMLRGYKMTVS